MASSINPNLGISTNLGVRPTSGNGASAPAEAATQLPSDGLSVDFSKAGPAAAPAEAQTAAPQAPSSPAAPAPAPETKSAVAQAAADGGLAVSTTGGLAQLEAPPAPEFNASIDG